MRQLSLSPCDDHRGSRPSLLAESRPRRARRGMSASSSGRRQRSRARSRGCEGQAHVDVYEDKESANLNASFKAELSKLARGDRYRSAVVLVPVADVRGYDYWPVRGFVKDAIRDESKKLGATIYCDWSGSFSRALGIRRATSSIILVGKDGSVLFHTRGNCPLDRIEARHISLLRAEVEGPG